MDLAVSIDYTAVIIRFIHVLAAIMWVGIGYWLNFVNNPLQMILDLETRQKIAPKLMPRTMFWFEEAGNLTVLAGVLLLIVHYYMDGQLFAEGYGWGMPSYVMLVVVFLGWFVYDWLYRGPLKKNDLMATAVSLILLAGLLFLFERWAGWNFRGYTIHTGALFGFIMIFNFKMRLQPLQKLLGQALMAGTPPDPEVMFTVQTRARHNISLSIPLVLTMLGTHYETVGSMSRYILWGAIVLGFVVADWLIKKAATVKGM